MRRMKRSCSDTPPRSYLSTPVRIPRSAAAPAGAAGETSCPSSRLPVERARRPSGRLEDHPGVAEGELVALLELALADPRPVDPGPVRRTQVDEGEAVALGVDLGVAPADVRVVDRDVALRQAPHA